MASDITQRASGRCLNRDCSYSFDAPVSLLSFMLFYFVAKKPHCPTALAHLYSRAELFLTLASYDFIYVILYMFT